MIDLILPKIKSAQTIQTIYPTIVIGENYFSMHTEEIKLSDVDMALNLWAESIRKGNDTVKRYNDIIASRMKRI